MTQKLSSEKLVSGLLQSIDPAQIADEGVRQTVELLTSVVFLVYRSTREQLDEACRYLQSCFLRPAWVVRETEYPWRVWLQTFPISWERLMAVPYNPIRFS